MKKMIQVFLFLFLFVYPNVWGYASEEITSITQETLSGTTTEIISDEVSVSDEEAGVFAMYETVKTQRSKITALEAKLSVAEKSKEDLTSQQEELRETLNQLESLSTTYIDPYYAAVEADESSSGSIVFDESFSWALENYSDLLSVLESYLALEEDISLDMLYIVENYGLIYSQIATSLEAVESELSLVSGIIEKLNLEIQQAEEHLTRLQEDFQIQLIGYLKHAWYFIILVTLLYGVSKIISWSIHRSPRMSEEKQMVLSSIIFIVRNILIFILVFIFFFSEFLSVLPALAIVGTAMGIALRDVISAFIAWFIIGMKDTTYKLGDIIEIPSEEIFGRVIKIHPLVTVVQELGLSGPNSKVRTFSNKLIFSASINNLSKNHGWVYIPVECMLTYESNITLAKEILLRTMNEILSQDNISHLDTMKAKLKRSGIPEDKLYPMVFTDVRMQGIFLRGKMLIKWEDRHEVRNRVSELFIQEIQKTQEVELRYIDSWVSEVQ